MVSRLLLCTDIVIDAAEAQQSTDSQPDGAGADPDADTADADADADASLRRVSKRICLGIAAAEPPLPSTPLDFVSPTPAEHVAASSSLASLAFGLPASSTPTSKFTLAAAALWALCALVMANKPLQTIVGNNERLVVAILALLSNNLEEVQSSAAWTLCNTVADIPHLQKRMVQSYSAAEPLLAIIRSSTATPASKGLAAWGIRTMIFEHPDNQIRVYRMDALPALAALIGPDMASHPSAQASAIWAIAALASGVPEIQDATRMQPLTPGSPSSASILDTIVAHLDSPNPQVAHQATVAIYNLCSRCTDNQTAVAAAGAMDKIVTLLQFHHSHPQSSSQASKSKMFEKSIAALLCLVLKHTDNQRSLGANTIALAAIANTLLTATEPRVQGLAAGLVRVLCVEQPRVQAILAAHGVIAALTYIASVTPSDRFAQEQAVAALYNILYSNVSFFIICFFIYMFF